MTEEVLLLLGRLLGHIETLVDTILRIEARQSKTLKEIQMNQQDEANLIATATQAIKDAEARIVGKINDLVAAQQSAGGTTPEVDAATQALLAEVSNLGGIVPAPVAPAA